MQMFTYTGKADFMEETTYKSVEPTQVSEQGCSFCRLCCLCLMLSTILSGVLLWWCFLREAHDAAEARGILCREMNATATWAWPAWAWPARAPSRFFCSDVSLALSEDAFTADTGRNTSTTSTRSAHIDFDCDADYAAWEQSWSSDKKSWCCERMRRGCAVTTANNTYDCTVGLDGSIGSASKIAWCCLHTHIGCSTTTTTSSTQFFNCSAGFPNWATEWSRVKKRWCCSHEQRGCKGGPQAAVVGTTQVQAQASMLPSSLQPTQAPAAAAAAAEAAAGAGAGAGAGGRRKWQQQQGWRPEQHRRQRPH